MIHYFLAELHHMAESEMLDMLAPGTIDGIKAAGDAHPLIKVYSIAHEGKATPTMVTSKGKVAVTIQYLRDAVSLVGRKIREGVAVFNNHAATNAHAGRMPIGRVVGKVVKEIDGILHALTAIHIFPKHREDDLDIASYEANAKFGTDKENRAQLWDLEDITGIALGSSKEGQTPAFPGATLRGAFQHFAGQTSILEGDKQMTTLSEVVDAVSKGGFSPSEVFGNDTIMAEKSVKEAVEAAEKNQQGQYETKRRLLESAESRNDELKGQIAEKDVEIKKFNASILTQKAGGLFEKIATDRKMDEPQKKFCQLRLKEFASEAAEEAVLLKELNEFTDKALQEHEVVAKEVFGVKPGENTPAGAPPNTDPAQGNGDDFTDPKNNPWIPQ